MREGAGADVRLAAVRRDVGDLADRVRDPGRLAQASGGQDLAALLDLQVADHGEQVGVAGALAVAVDGALHVRGARRHRGEGVGHRAAGVVVAVDAHARPGARPGRRPRRPRPAAAASRRWCRTARRPRRRPRPRCAPPPGRSRGRRGSRRRSARRPGRPAAPRRAGRRRCRAPSRGSPRRSCAGPSRRGAGGSWPRASRPGRRSRAAPHLRVVAAADAPARRVAPKAASVAWRSESSCRARAKNSVSLGLAPGQPPSMKPDPEVVEVRGDGQLVRRPRG